MNCMKTLLVLALVVSAAMPAEGAVILHPVLHYQSRAQSPFFADILLGRAFLEDFEDHALNDVPGVTISNGNATQNSGQSVDEDDGVLGTGYRGGYWIYRDPGAGVQSDFVIRFSPNSSGLYPTQAGYVMLAPRLSTAVKTWALAYDPAGNEITGGGLQVTIPAHPDGYSLTSSWGHTFLGLTATQGIARIEVYNGSAGMDHIQVGWGAVPEPGTAGLAVCGAAVLLRRRRIPKRGSARTP